MDFNKSIKLETYSDKANKQFKEMQSRLSKIESSFQTRMNGRTTGKLIGSFIFTLIWIAAFGVALYYAKEILTVYPAREELDEYLHLGAMISLIGLFLFMIIDNVMNFSYYGKISSYKNSISQLKNRVDIGKNSIKANHDAFMESKSKGWNYHLEAGASISEEASSVESTVSNMEALKKGFLNGAKNVFYYISAIVFAVLCCDVALIIFGDLINELFDGELSADTFKIIKIVVMVIFGVVEIFLARWIWSKTNCAVTNKTLFIVLLGPVATTLAVALIIAVIALVLAIIQFVIAIAGVVIAGALAFSCLCGG